MNKREMHRIVRWFQRRVGLCGWTIKILPGLSNPGNDLGECIHDVPYHSVRIWINSEAHVPGAKGAEGEAHTLFHELIHAFFAECGITEQGEPSEWGVNQLASNLLQLYMTESAT